MFETGFRFVKRLQCPRTVTLNCCGYFDKLFKNVRIGESVPCYSLDALVKPGILPRVSWYEGETLAPTRLHCFLVMGPVPSSKVTR